MYQPKVIKLLEMLQSSDRMFSQFFSETL